MLPIVLVKVAKLGRRQCEDGWEFNSVTLFRDVHAPTKFRPLNVVRCIVQSILFKRGRIQVSTRLTFLLSQNTSALGFKMVL